MPDSLIVNRKSSAKVTVGLLFLAICAFRLYTNMPLGRRAAHQLLSPHSHSGGSIVDPVLAIAFVCALLFFVLAALFVTVRSAFHSGESLTCDRTTLTAGRIPIWNFRGNWQYESFSVASIEQAHYGIVHIREYGGGMGIVFTSGARSIKLLEGLEAPEANQILDALRNLGVNIVKDVAMPMLIEMANSRRNGKFGWFWS